jgi:hypothetical protein
VRRRHIMAIKTREEWLGKLTRNVELHVFRPAGYDVPDVHIACGWPSTRGLSAKRRRIGECWSRKCSEDGVHQIFISPYISDTPEVAATVVHELGHAAVGSEAKHGALFRAMMKAVGLEGKPTSTHAGDELTVQLVAITDKLGPYPHAALKASEVDKKKQSTRLIKAECPGCGYVIRTTRKWIDEAGLPTCPCGEEFVEEEKGEEHEQHV